MNCIYLNIKPCWSCRDGIMDIPCMIESYKDHINKGGTDAIKRWVLWCKNSESEIAEIVYLSETIKSYFPEHLDYFNKLAVLL